MPRTPGDFWVMSFWEEKEDGEKKVEKETVEEEEVGAANPGLLQTKISPSNV